MPVQCEPENNYKYLLSWEAYLWQLNLLAII